MGRLWGSVSYPYVIRTGDRAGQTCGKPHTQHRCFSRLDDAWRIEFGDEAERPRWAKLLRSGVAIFDLDYDAILAAMYALSVSGEGDCYLCVPHDPGIEAAALVASESALPSTAPTEALHTFTLHSGASRWSSLYTLATEPPQVAASAQVSALGQVAPPFSCSLLSHQTLLWHHRLGHPSLPHLRGMHSRLLDSGLPRSMPPLPPSPAPPCLLCVEGRQRAAPHSSSFPLTTAPLQTLHMDVWAQPASVDRTGRAPVPGIHVIAFRPSSVPLRVPLPPPHESSLPAVLDYEPDLARAASPTLTRLLATVVTGPSFESTSASALIAELVDFAAACRLDYATILVTESESESDCPPSVGGECALDTNVFEDRHEDFECLAGAVPHLVAMLLAPEEDPDAKAITGSYSSRWQTLRRLVYDLREAPREWHNTLRTKLSALGFSPSTADLSLHLCTDTSLPPFYVFVYVDDLVFATADTEVLALVKSELQKRHTCTDLGELRIYLGLQIIRERARRTITLTQSDMVHQVLHLFGFRYSSPHSTPLPTGHSLSAPPSDKSVEPSGPYPELVGCLMYLMTCTRPDLAYPLSILARYVVTGRHRPEHWEAAKRVLRYLCSTSGMGLVLGGRGPVVLSGHADAFWVDDLATQRSSQGQKFSLGSGSVSWRSTRSSSVLSSSCEAEIYARAMAAQELRWLTYLLTSL
ncbi:unnamed protein product [Closterium sp. NIES-53]